MTRFVPCCPTMKLLFALLLIISLASFVPAQSVVKMSASKILSDVAERKNKQPGITSKELAAYANELLETRGFDYDFDVCDILSSRDKKSTAPFLSKRYRASLTNGRELTLKLNVLNPQESLCGECWLLIPTLQVTKREIHLIAKGQTHRIRRTSAFYLDEAQLIDSSLKKVLRRWELPFQTVPIGISVDGTKLYTDVNYDPELFDLALEVSEDGTVAFRDRAALGLKKGMWMEDFVRDPKNAYLSFMKFEVGNKTYIIRFTAPCT